MTDPYTPEAILDTSLPPGYTAADADRDLEVAEWRLSLHKALTDAAAAADQIGRALGQLGSDRLYDVEIAEDDTAAMQAALTGLRVNLAALRDLTSAATEDC